MKENNENKAKALEENKKNYSSENSTPQNGEDIILISATLLSSHDTTVFLRFS